MAKLLRRSLLALLPIGILAGTGLSLAGCVVAPGYPGYYAEPAPVYAPGYAPGYGGPSYYYGPRHHYWRGGGYHHGWRRWH